MPRNRLQPRLLIALLWLRVALVILFGLTSTWWLGGADAWFESPLPGRRTVFLSALALGAAALACTSVLRFGLARLPEDVRGHRREHPLAAEGELGAPDSGRRWGRE
jgi:hypothetical protein